MRTANNKLYKLFQTEDAARVALVEMNKEFNLTQISKNLGVGKDTVTEWFKRLHIGVNQNTFKNSLTGRKLKKEPDKSITKEYLSDLYFNQHKTQEEIAKLTGLAKWTIQNLFREHDIEPRKTKNRTVSQNDDKKINDKGWLYEQHITQGRSMENISQELHTSASCIKNKLSKFKIPQNRSFGNSIWKVFADESSAIQTLQEWNQTMSLSDIAESLTMSVAAISLWFKKYNIIPKIHYTSKEQREMFDWIKTIDDTVAYNDRQFLSGTEIDVFVPEKKFGIELNGVWHHSTYRSSNKNRHKNKTDKMNALGGRLFQIYDFEWNQKQDIVKSILLNSLDYTKTKELYARQLEIAELTQAELDEFLNKNHIQGTCTSSVRLGLVDQNKEVWAVMSFTPSRFDRNVEWELTRFCNKINTRIAGGASKLLENFKRLYQPTSIVSYADKRISNGSLYLKLLFVQDKEIDPGFHYVLSQNTKFLIKNNQNSKKIFKKFIPTYDDTKSNEENGIYKIYDCGKLKYIWTKQELI
jgi:transposase